MAEQEERNTPDHERVHLVRQKAAAKEADEGTAEESGNAGVLVVAGEEAAADDGPGRAAEGHDPNVIE